VKTITSPNHYKYMWWFLPQVQITTNTCGDIVQGWVIEQKVGLVSSDVYIVS